MTAVRLFPARTNQRGAWALREEEKKKRCQPPNLGALYLAYFSGFSAEFVVEGPDWFRAKGTISSGVVEGLNGVVKLTTRKAFGFRTAKGFESALPFCVGPRCWSRNSSTNFCCAGRLKGFQRVANRNFLPGVEAEAPEPASKAMNAASTAERSLVVACGWD